MARSRVEVVSFGEALIDFFPAARAADSSARGPAFEQHLGGAPSNFAVGLSRLGVPSALLTRVSDDAFGDFIVSTLDREGVEVAGVERCDRRTAVTFITWNADNEPSFLFYRERSADAAVDAPFVERHRGAITGADVLHLCSNSLTLEPAASATYYAVELARASGLTISVDLNLRLHLWPDRQAALRAARWLVEQADWVKLCEQEAILLSDERDLRRAARRVAALGPALVVITRGADGALWHGPRGEGSISAPAVQVVDTTGAGDGFWAAAVAGLLRHRPDARGALAEIEAGALEALLARAARAGALVCTRVGATTALPTIATLDGAGD